MITNLRRNRMGTVSFDGQFTGMRKAQEFIVYPMKDQSTRATIQSDTRIGTIDMQSGVLILSKPRSSGAYFVDLIGAKPIGKLSMCSLTILQRLTYWRGCNHDKRLSEGT